MIYVLDTDILSLLAHKDSPEAPRIRQRILELPTEHSVATAIINALTFHDSRFMAYNSFS
jgi:hypothetical protein